MKQNTEINNKLKIENKIINEKHFISVWNGNQECELSSVEHPILENLSAHLLIKNDLSLVIAQCELGINIRKKLKTKDNACNPFDLENKDHLICSSIFTSSIITYAKCFTQADRRKVTLKEDIFKKNKDADLIDMHREIMRLRNTWVAHSGHSGKEGQARLIVHYNDDANHARRVPLFLGATNPIPETAHLTWTLHLAQHLIDHINEKLPTIEESFHKSNDLDEILSKTERKKIIEMKY